MKIRLNYVSNSSSSSFIICGDNIKELIKKGNNIEDVQYIESLNCFFDDIFHISVTFGEINNEIFLSLKEPSDKEIFDLINEKMLRKFYNYIRWNDPIYDCFDSVLKFSEKTISLIEKYKNLDKNNSNDNDLDKYSEKIEKSISEDVNKIISEWKNKYKEIMMVSAGDNHGDITGEIGWYIESEYLGLKTINNTLKTNFEIIQINQH